MVNSTRRRRKKREARRVEQLHNEHKKTNRETKEHAALMIFECDDYGYRYSSLLSQSRRSILCQINGWERYSINERPNPLWRPHFSMKELLRDWGTYIDG